MLRIPTNKNILVKKRENGDWKCFGFFQFPKDDVQDDVDYDSSRNEACDQTSHTRDQSDTLDAITSCDANFGSTVVFTATSSAEFRAQGTMLALNFLG